MSASNMDRGSRPWWRKAIERILVFGLIAVADVGLTAGLSTAGSDAFESLGLVLSLWIALGFVLTLLELAAWRILFGPGGDDRVSRYVCETWSGFKRDAGRPIDRRRVAILLSVVAGLAILLLVSGLWLRYLILFRHGTTLIVLAFLAGQAVLVVACALLGVAAFHRLHGGLKKLDPEGPIGRAFTIPFLVRAALLTGGLLLVAVIAVRIETVMAIDGFAFLLIGLALAARPLGRRLLPDRLMRPWLLLALPVLALGGMFVASQAEPVRRVVITDTMTAKYVYSALQGLSDFDGDGAPSFPYLSDCAPFDAGVHPRAAEIPGNGIDEDCDGLDEVVGNYDPLRREAKLGRKKVRRDLVLITLDATRADHTGFMGYGRDTTPNLDDFATQGSIFTAAFAQDSGTGPSLWSLMVGKTPFQTELSDADVFPPQLAESETTLASRLAAEGYDTVALVCGDVFGKKKDKKTWNIRRGFRVFREICGRKMSKQAEATTAKALVELKRLRAGKKPYFLWIHYLDPHHPYTHHQGDAFGPTKIDAYDEEIRYMDQHLAPLLAALKTGKRQPWVAITADHGENFGEHGTAPHARTLYLQVTHVPLIIRAPKGEGRQIDAPVAVGDIHPTFLELASIPHPEEVTMVSQAAIVLGEEADQNRLVFQENSYSRPRRDAKAVVGARYHLIWDSTNDIYELYDRIADPEEGTNLAGQGLPREAELRRFLKRFSQSTKVPPRLSK